MKLLETIKEKSKPLIVIIDQLALRERILILLSMLAIVYFSWRSVILDNLSSSKQQVSGTASRLRRQIFSLQEKIDIVQKENVDLQKQLDLMTEGLISPKDMTSLLKLILDKHKGLTVMHVENIKATPVFGGENDNEEKVSKEALKIFQVYKHGIEFVVSGTFFQLRDFLEEAEKLPWKVLWEELEYSVTKYPLASIKIVIKTLSLDPNLFSTS
jgi:MSHA biogenesis protein MshJ